MQRDGLMLINEVPGLVPAPLNLLCAFALSSTCSFLMRVIHLYNHAFPLEALQLHCVLHVFIYFT